MLIKGSFDCTKNVEKLEYNFLVEEGVKELSLIISIQNSLKIIERNIQISRSTI